MIKLALIGCGHISATHVSRFQRHASRMKVVATVDTNLELAQQAAALVGAEKVATDYREVLSEVDAVLVALPHHLYHPIGKECMLAGKHVLMEKPLANTQEECLDLIDVSKSSGTVYMVGYCMRYHPLIQQIKQIIADKTYGETFQVSIWTEQFTQYAPESWVSQAKLLGGGQFFSHGCHYIDLLLWFLGEPVRGTHLGTRLGTPWMEKEGTSNVCLKFKSGALGFHMGTWGARGTQLQNSMHIHCTEGMLEFTPDRSQLILHQGALEGESGNSKVLSQTDVGIEFECEMAHFLDCIENNQQPLTNVDDSLKGLQIIWKLYEAEQNNLVADLSGMGF
jgi:predicted dehydrogenase